MCGKWVCGKSGRQTRILNDKGHRLCYFRVKRWETSGPNERFAVWTSFRTSYGTSCTLRYGTFVCLVFCTILSPMRWRKYTFKFSKYYKVVSSSKMTNTVPGESFLQFIVSSTSIYIVQFKKNRNSTANFPSTCTFALGRFRISICFHTIQKMFSSRKIITVRSVNGQIARARYHNQKEKVITIDANLNRSLGDHLYSNTILWAWRQLACSTTMGSLIWSV